MSQPLRARPAAPALHDSAADAAATARIVQFAKAQETPPPCCARRRHEPPCRRPCQPPRRATFRRALPTSSPWAVAGRPPSMLAPVPSVVPAPAAATATSGATTAALQTGGMNARSIEPRAAEPVADCGARADELISTFVPRVAQRSTVRWRAPCSSPAVLAASSATPRSPARRRNWAVTRPTRREWWARGLTLRHPE